MPKFRDHLKHSIQRHPEIPSEIHERVHRWMDNPANRKINQEYSSGDRKSTRLNSSHIPLSRMPSSA